MLPKEELYKQSLNDLLRVVVVLCEILETKELSRVESKRIDYGTKVLKEVTKKQKYINKLD